MEECPRCGLGVAELYPLPPGIITKEVIAGIRTDDEWADLEACRDCIFDLMEN